LIETKDYANNVPKEETDKFIRDVAQQKCNGIFLSQSSGISLKENYQIEFNKGTTRLYPQLRLRPRTKIAVDIIDNMSLKFAELEPTCDDEDEDTNRISTAVLDEIYAEFQDFALKKDALITLLKESHKR
jgi:hypothetical protein